ncbi:MAG: GTPase ObgE [Bifidobacteriaceae bacterium]|jgi:GTP-binding protein|nr:GTPase ObgE [Bifidobacteriaceae bacterium]
MATFVDIVKIKLQAGSGGKGCVSVRREKYKPLAGPDGGNGGDGGSIIFEAKSDITSLLEFKFSSLITAKNGEIGRGSKKDGANARDIVLNVPIGTVIKVGKTQIEDLDFEGKQFIAAKGGIGGLGNAALANKKIISPKFALLGTPGEEKIVTLELKTIADIGLVGFPSSGKSSLISAISSAHPKIADYPFTTLTPHLGVVAAYDQHFTVADVPGLIPGASEGKGMGYEFLRHIERVSIIAHIIDLAPMDEERNPKADLEAIEKELKTYESNSEAPDSISSLLKKKRIIILNKADAVDKETIEKAKNQVCSFGWETFVISAASHLGLDSLKKFFANAVQEAKIHAENEKTAKNATAKVLKIKPKNDAIEIKKVKTKEGYYFSVTGSLPQIWAMQIDWNNDDAVAFFSSSLDKLGLDKRLKELSVKEGDQIRVGPGDTPYIFEYREN